MTANAKAYSMIKFAKYTIIFQNIILLIAFAVVISVRMMPYHITLAQERFERGAVIVALIGVMLIFILSIAIIVHLLYKRYIESGKLRQWARISLILAFFIIPVSLFWLLNHQLSRDVQQSKWGSLQ
jgi:hypothetical protein